MVFSIASKKLFSQFGISYFRISAAPTGSGQILAASGCYYNQIYRSQIRHKGLGIVTTGSIHSRSNPKMPVITVLPENFEETIDPIQRELLAEECILVDSNDNILGHESKKNCHLVQENGDILLHRAFSVFLFNTKGELLLQKRSKVKVTFPSMYTNTCCSHPLFRNDEMIENEGFGVKVAAQRRLYEELGIPKEDIPLEVFQYLTRIHYKASSNSIWGEHEIDYIFVIKRDVMIHPNPNEIDDVRYVSLDELKDLKNQKDVKLTPWFNLILESGKLQLWWKNLNNLKPFEDHETIHKM